jgi:hypothetical protein
MKAKANPPNTPFVVHFLVRLFTFRRVRSSPLFEPCGKSINGGRNYTYEAS